MGGVSGGVSGLHWLEKVKFPAGEDGDPGKRQCPWFAKSTSLDKMGKKGGPHKRKKKERNKKNRRPEKPAKKSKK